MQSLPKQIKIGALTYEIKEEARTAVDGNYGVILYADSIISLQPGLSPQYREITLWHEMIHAILFGAGMREHDEQAIHAIAHGVVQLLKDNPGMLVK